MGKVTSTNYSASGTDFPVVTGTGNPLLKEDLFKLQAALEEHTHAGTRGLPVRRLDTANAPAATGQVRVNGEAFQWWNGSGVQTAVTLTGSETLANKTLTTPTIASLTNAQHTHQNAAGGGALDAAAITGSVTGSGSVVKATAPTVTTLTVGSGGIAVTGASSIVGALTGLTGLTVASGGATITAGGLAVTAGGLAVGGNSVLTNAAAGVTKIKAAATGDSILRVVPSDDLNPTTTVVQVTNAAEGSTVFGITKAGEVFSGANAASAGVGKFRLPNATNIAWRNAANSGDLAIQADAADRLVFAASGASWATSAGGSTPATASLFLSVVVNGSAYKIPLYP